MPKRDAVSDLGYGTHFKSQSPSATRDAIISLWKRFRGPFAKELGRGTPTYFDSPYVGIRNVAQDGTQLVLQRWVRTPIARKWLV